MGGGPSTTRDSACSLQAANSTSSIKSTPPLRPPRCPPPLRPRNGVQKLRGASFFRGGEGGLRAEAVPGGGGRMGGAEARYVRQAAQIKPADARIVPTRLNAAYRAGLVRNRRILRAGQAIQQRIGSGGGGGPSPSSGGSGGPRQGGGGGLSAGTPPPWA